MVGIRGIVFDKAGTLIDFERSWVPALVGSAEELAMRAGRPNMAAVMLEAVGRCPDTGRILPGSQLAAGTTDVVAAQWRDLVPELPPLQSLIPWIDDYWNRVGHEHLTPVGDVAGFMSGLSQRGIKLGVATNDSEAGARQSMSTLGIETLVDFVAGYDSVARPKPSPDMILAFCDAVGLMPGNVAMVGDSVGDLTAGRSAGCGLVVGVLTGPSDASDLEPYADFVVTDLHHIADLI